MYLQKKEFLLKEIAKGRDKTRALLLEETNPWMIARLYKSLDDLLLHYIEILDSRA